MIEVKLQEIAERLGKNISDIARETGLNRNTVTDLFHNKVDGIKFSTIDTLCETYGLTLQDLVTRKEFRIGAAPTSKIIRVIRSISPLYSWFFLNALHKPASRFFEAGAGNVYAFFVRSGTEVFVDRREVNRSAERIYARYRAEGLDETYTVFLRARDQILTSLSNLASQPLNQYVSPDLVKTFQRLGDLIADFLSVSAWIDVFDFGVRSQIVHQLQKAHSFSSAETAVLLASGEVTSSVTQRLAILRLSKSVAAHSSPLTPDSLRRFVAENREAKHFSSMHPHVSSETLIKEIKIYVANSLLLKAEENALLHLPSEHAKAVKIILRTHNLRTNPLAFFARLEGWREERDEIQRRVIFQLARILRILAKRCNIAPQYAPYLLPQELEHLQTGLVTERTLKHRAEEGMLVALEQGTYTVHEGEQAVSIQDDLASRYLSQLAYEGLS